MTLPTEPIGSTPRRRELIDANAARGGDDPPSWKLYDATDRCRIGVHTRPATARGGLETGGL